MSTALVVRSPSVQTLTPFTPAMDNARRVTHEDAQQADSKNTFVTVLKTVFFFAIPVFMLISYLANQLAHCMCGEEDGKNTKIEDLRVRLTSGETIHFDEETADLLRSMFTGPTANPCDIAWMRAAVALYNRQSGDLPMLTAPSSVIIEEMEDEVPAPIAAPAPSHSRKVSVNGKEFTQAVRTGGRKDRAPLVSLETKSFFSLFKI